MRCSGRTCALPCGTGAKPVSIFGRKKRDCTTTRCVHRARALEAGADWFEQRGEQADAAACRAEAAAILSTLDGFWREDLQFYKSRILESHAPSAKELDISVIFAAIHAGGDSRNPLSAGSAHACDAGATGDVV